MKDKILHLIIFILISTVLLLLYSQFIEVKRVLNGQKQLTQILDIHYQSISNARE